MELMHLQNGSDIRGIAIKTQEYNQTLTDEAIARIGYAGVKWIQNKLNLPYESLNIAIGYDCRLSADQIKNQLIEGMKGFPVTITDVGMATTPSMFFANQYPEVNCQMSIMITASHLPYEYNGLKFFTELGGAESEDISDILNLAESLSEEDLNQESQCTVTSFDLLDLYAKDLVNTIRKGINNGNQPLKGRHIIVDAGNGMGGFFASKVLEPLGANTKGSQYLDPDGTFPNHAPNPDNKEAMASIRQAVLDNQADLGIIFDTDVDRAAVVDEKGETFNRNNLIALISAILLEEEPGATIVTNSATSNHLRDFIEGLGGRQDLYLTGYRNVINRATDLQEQGINAVLAIETSGHAALKENQMLDDGAYLVAKLIIADAKLASKGKKLGALIDTLKQPVETNEKRFKIIEEPIIENGERIIEEFKERVKQTEDMELIPDHIEGMRANVSGKYGSGWFLVRLSLHEPLLVWTLENDVEGSIDKVMDELQDFFDNQSALE